MTMTPPSPAVDERTRALVDGFVDGERETLVDLCRQLVEARSVNPPGDTRAAAAVVHGFLAAHGLDCERIASVPDKPGVVAGFDGHAGGRHLVLNGHLDTIPPGDERDWSVPPFSLTRRDGRLFGLGLGNMKAAVAALALACVFLQNHRDRWCGRVSFTAVPDETVFGPHGAAWLLDERPELLGDALICGEGPGGMQLSVAEKGVLWLAIEAGAPPGQGMLGRRGGSAIARLARVIGELDALNELHTTPPPPVAVLADNAGEQGLRLSVNAGRIEGGGLISQVAAAARAEVDVRIPPGMTIAGVEDRVDAITRTVEGTRWRRIKGWEPNWTVPGEAIVHAVADAASQVRGRPPALVVRLPASDGSRWRARGVPAICYGPQPGLAAGVDDHAFEQDVVDCAKVYALAAIAYLNRVDRFCRDEASIREG